MRFHKHVPQESREVLAEQLRKYEKEMEMTPNERRALHKWVAAGNSPYDNGDYIYGENGWPMDFVSALRFEEEQLEWFRSLSEGEQQELLSESTVYDTEMDEPVLIGARVNDKDMDPDAELPF